MKSRTGRHRRVNFVGSYVVACLAAMSCLAACGASAAARSPVVTRVAFTAPPAPQGTISFSCTSSTECVALTVMSNGALAAVVTHDAGRLWTVAGFLPGDIQSLSELSCFATQVCVTAGTTTNNDSVLLTSSDGGVRWKQLTIRKSRNTNSVDLVCSSSTTCSVIRKSYPRGLRALTTTDRGATWTRAPLPAAVAELATAPACTPSGAFCYAVAREHSQHYAFITASGALRGWRITALLPATVIGSSDGFWSGAIACASAESCVATVEQPQPAIWSTSDGGKGWSPSVLPAELGRHVVPDDATCTGGDRCMAVANVYSKVGSRSTEDLVALESVDGGSTWSAALISDSPGLWILPPVLGGFPFIPSVFVHCTTPSECLVLATGVSDIGVSSSFAFASSDGGAQWSRGAVPSGIDQLTSASCRAAGQCVVVGYGTKSTGELTGVDLTSADGGRTWQRHVLPPEAQFVMGVSCSSSQHCVALAWHVTPYSRAGVSLVSSDSGFTWSTFPILHGLRGDEAIVCPTTMVCASVGDGSALASSTGGRIWTSSAPPGEKSPSALTCTSASRCVSVSSNSNQAWVTADGGVRWERTKPIAGIAHLDGVVCPTATECLAVGAKGNGVPGAAVYSRDGGRTWSNAHLPSGLGSLSSPSCVGSRECLAWSSQHNDNVLLVSADAGRSWSIDPSAGTNGTCDSGSISLVSGSSGPTLVSIGRGKAHTGVVIEWCRIGRQVGR